MIPEVCSEKTDDMKRYLNALIVAAAVLAAFPEECIACTSVIISGKRTADGRPVMLKHRDTDDLNNAVQYFTGPLYNFIGLVNSSSPGNEAWTGTNTAGFSIMNTASYNIKDDDVPDSDMDREGQLMYKALGLCSTLSDFENLLDTLPRPLGVEANFGVIDAFGGAAYYEVNNHSFVKYDVAASESGYRVVTNFSESGRPEDYMGYERYLTASAIMSELMTEDRASIGHTVLFDNISRSYRHEVLGIDPANGKGMTDTGILVDQDFIPRRITSASIVIEGVATGENPLHTVMWTILGYPGCSVAVPLMAGDECVLPGYVVPAGENNHSLICDTAMSIKKSFVFTDEVSNGSRYFDAKALIDGRDGNPALIECSRAAEKVINEKFGKIYSEWTAGKISDKKFFRAYASMSNEFFEDYLSNFAAFVKY